MLRMNLTICLAFACCVFAYAEDAQPNSETPDPVPAIAEKSTATREDGLQKPKPSVLKKRVANAVADPSDDSKLTTAVHVNSTGIDSGYTTTRKNGTVNRLRSIRDSVFLPPGTRTAKVGDNTTGSESNNRKVAASANGSSRRPKFSMPDAAAAKVLPKTKSSAIAPSDQLPRKILPSVITRRGSDEPTPAMKVPDPAAIGSVGSEAEAKTKKGSSETANKAKSPSLVADQPQRAAPQDMPALSSSEPAPAVPSVAVPDVPKSLRQVPQSLNASVETAPKATPVAPRIADIRVDLPQASTPKLLEANGPFREIDIAPLGTLTTDHQPSPPNKLAETRASRFTPTFSARASEESKSPTAKPRPRVTKSTSPKQPEEDGSVLLSNRSPVLVVKTHGQATIRVGRVATYHVTAANAGDLDAADVVVSVNVPNWAELSRNQASVGTVRIEPSSSGDNVLRWSIRNLKQQSKQRLRIDLIPRKSRPIELGVVWNFKSVSAMAQIQVQEAKLEVGVVGPSDVQYGETKLYTITVSNPGTGDAEHVTLTLLPINDGSGAAAVKELGVIKAQSRRTIEVELTARQAGELAVRASATGDGGLKANGKQDVRVRRANLVVEAVGPAKKIAGSSARYAVKVTNNGDATAQDVVVIAALPMASQYVKSSNAGKHDSQRGRVRWAIGPLRAGAYQVVEVTTVLNSAGTNRLDVRSAGVDKLVASAAVETTVQTLPDLKMTVDDPAGVVALGTEMSYDIRIVNRGTAAAYNVNVVGYFSEGIEPVAVRGWRADVEVGQVILDTIPQISPGQEITVKVIAKASRPGDHVFRAELHSKEPQTKLAQEEWTVFQGQDDEPSLSGPSIQKADKTSDAAEVESQFR